MSQIDFNLMDEFYSADSFSAKPEYLKYLQKPQSPYDADIHLRVPDHIDFPNNIDGKKAKHRTHGTGNVDKPFHDDLLVRKCALVLNEINRRNPGEKEIGLYIKDPDMRVMSIFGDLEKAVEASCLIRRIFSAYSQNQHVKLNPLQMVKAAEENPQIVILHQEKDRFDYFPEGYDVKRLSGQMKTSFDRLKTFIERQFETVTLSANTLHDHGFILTGTNRFNVDAAAALASRGKNRILEGQLITDKWLNRNLPEVIALTENRPERPNYHGIATPELAEPEIVPNQTFKILAPS